MENLEQKAITSVEVADMVGKPHNDLMKDIRRYTSQFNEGNISHVEFFTENTYLDKKVRQMVYRDIYSQLKREFGIYDDDGKTKSYKALKRKDLADAHEFIDCYTLSAYLQEIICDCNAQIGMEGGACAV